MKKFLFFSALFLFSFFFGVELSAQNVFSVEDITINPGETKSVSIDFTNATNGICAFSLVVDFPKWATVSNAKFVSSRTNDEGTPDATFNPVSSGSTKYKLWYQASDGGLQYYITGNSGTLFTFDLTAATDAPVGETATVGMSLYEMYDVDMNEVEYSFSPFNITVGAAAAETETVTLTKEYNTYIPAKDLDFSGVEGIKAYYVTAVTATEATLTEATTVAAGEGIIISGTPDDYEVPVAAEAVTKNTDNLLKTSGIAVNDYILYDGKFVLCSDGELAEGKAYLPASAITSGAKVINIVFGGESTGISEVKKSEADSAIYNLSGMRVSKTQKGVYIMNGRKVIVK